jgi:hypothetical protein
MRKRFADFAGTVRRVVRFVLSPWLLSDRSQKLADDYKTVADDYFDALHFLDEYSLYRSLYLKGRGGKWRLIVEATHDLPLIRTDGDSPLEAIQEFRRQQSNADLTGKQKPEKEVSNV